MCDLQLMCLQALAKFAFGLGTLQMLLCTLAFTLFALPVGNSIGTQILVKVFHASPDLAAIRTVDEAIVIGAALSLSSSAFVLQLLSENGELSSKFGSATLGILLLQVSNTRHPCSECIHKNTNMSSPHSISASMCSTSSAVVNLGMCVWDILAIFGD